MGKKPDIKLDFKALLESLPGSIYWKDTNGVYLGCNQFVADMAGLPLPSDVVGRTDKDLVWKEYAELYRQHDLEVMQTGIPLIIEEPVLLANGKAFVFQAIKSPLKDDNGHIVGIVGTSVDVTLLKQKEMQAELYLQNIVSKMPGSVYWKDKNGVYLGCNQFVADMAGVGSPMEVIGKTDKDFPWKENFEIYKANDEEVMHRGQTLVTEEPIVLSNGCRRIYLNTKSPLTDENGQIIGIVGIAFDITERRQAELEIRDLKDDLEDSNEEKKLFMFVASTKVRNILMGVESGHQRLRTIQLPVSCEEVPDMLHSSVQKTLRIFDHMRDFLDLKDRGARRAELHTLAANALQYCTSVVTQKPIMVVLEYDPRLPFYQIVDVDRIIHILKNLLSNAASYTQSGLIKLKIEKLNRIRDTLNLKLTVSDTGCGISSPQLEGLLEVFDKTTIKNPYKSGGVVLSLTKKLADRMGGKLSVESQLNEGSTFTLLFSTEFYDSTYQLPFPSSIRLDTPVLFYSANPYFKEAFDFFMPDQNSQKVTPENVLELEKDTVFFIDSHAGKEAITHLMDYIRKNNTASIFALLVSPNIKESYAELFPENLCVVRLDLPITGKAMHEQFLENYEKWKTGKIPQLKGVISHQKIRVLYVEDHPVSRQAFSMLLEQENCQTTLYPDAEQALQDIQAHFRQQYDIIFLDLGLPGMNGLDLAREIRKNSVYKDIPIIASTAFIGQEYNIDYFEAGFNDALFKPVTLEALQQCLDKYVRHYHETMLLQDDD